VPIGVIALDDYGKIRVFGDRACFHKDYKQAVAEALWRAAQELSVS
jgi:hypothetical protein